MSWKGVGSHGELVHCVNCVPLSFVVVAVIVGRRDLTIAAQDCTEAP